jgi:hypothetical protein
MFGCNFEPTSPSTDTVAATKEAPAPVVIDEIKDCPSAIVDAAIIDQAAAALNPSYKKHFLLWEGDYGDDVLGKHIQSVRMVFVEDGTRYTVEYAGKSISVWERPDGTHGRQIQTYADEGGTGCLNFGIGGNVGEDNYTRRHMSWHSGVYDLGLVHHTYWQGRYEKALKALIRVAK